MSNFFKVAVHGVGLVVSSDDSAAGCEASRQLQLDFKAWPGDEGDCQAQAELKLYGSALHKNTQVKLPRLFRTRMGTAFGLGTRREVRFLDQVSVASLLTSGGRDLVASIYSPDGKFLREAAYMAALALHGELLDVRGFHRVHALGVSAFGVNALCLFGEKSGKSTLAMALRLAAPESVRFFSDETPILNQGMMHSYPTRLALRTDALPLFGGKALGDCRTFSRRNFPEKHLFEWQAGMLAAPGRVDLIFLDRGRGAETPTFAKASRAESLAALTSSMVLGLGVAQMREYFLRFNPAHLVRLAKIAASRAHTAVVVAQTTRPFGFQRSADPMANARALLDFMRSNS